MKLAEYVYEKDYEWTEHGDWVKRIELAQLYDTIFNWSIGRQGDLIITVPKHLFEIIDEPLID